MVGVQQGERLFDHAERTVAGALLCLGGEECLLAARLHDTSDVLFAPALRPAVDGRRVDVVDAEVEGAFDDGTAVSKLSGFSRAAWPPKLKMPTL